MPEQEDLQKLCERMGMTAREVKIKSLERLRDRIWEASHLIMCPYPEFNRIRKKLDEILKSIDEEVRNIKKGISEHIT